MNPLILNESARQAQATGKDGRTTPQQEQILMNFLKAKAQYPKVGKGSEELSPEEERARAEFLHAEQLLVESGVSETIIRAVCKWQKRS